MGVFPAASGKFLPLAFRAMMSEEVCWIMSYKTTIVLVHLEI